MKDKKLFISILVCGLIPLTVGLLIFFIWWAAKPLFLQDLYEFKLYGFCWILISIVIVTIGFVLIGIFLFRNSWAYYRYASIGALVLLVNIPAVFGVILKADDISNRAYVRIYNETNDLIVVSFKDLTFTKKLGAIANDENLTTYFYPTYLGEGMDSTPKYDSVKVTIISETKMAQEYLPVIYLEECFSIRIDSSLKMKVERDPLYD